MKATQKMKILAHLRTHGSITAEEAMRFRCFRLAARIADLRSDGYDIVTDNRDGEGNTVNYAIYRLKEEKKC